MYKHVTVMQTRLIDPRLVPQDVDNTLKQCITSSQPVYIELPNDMAGVQVLASPLETPIDLKPGAISRSAEQDAVATVLESIYQAKQPYILVDGLVAADQIIDEVNEFAKVTGFPTFSLTFGGGIIDQRIANYHGVHTGKYGSLDFTPYTETADLALLFGPLLSDTNTMGWSIVPDEDISIHFSRESVRPRTR